MGFSSVDPTDTGRTKYNWHLGGWGNPYAAGGYPSKGITSYGLSPNRQRPVAGVVSRGVQNSWRRVWGQVWYVLPPLAVAYWSYGWAVERNEYLNSKAGRMELAEDE